MTRQRRWFRIHRRPADLSKRRFRLPEPAARFLLLVALAVAVFLDVWPARTEPCGLPTETELGPLDPPPPQGPETWTLQEKWIWKQVLAGEVADFNRLYCEKEPLDPRSGDEVWQSRDRSEKPRQVSERFLVDVLTRKPFAEAVPARGLRIVGALFAAPIDLSGVDFDRQIWLDRSRFIGPVSLSGARLGSHLTFDYSTFQGAVDLTAARVDGDLATVNSTFQTVLNMDSLTVAGGLYLRDSTFKGNVNLHSAEVGGQLDTYGATFEAALDMGSLTVELRLLLSDGATFKGDVILRGAEVGGDLTGDGSTFHAALIMDNVTVDRNLFLRGATFKGDVNLIGAEVGGQFNASGSTFESALTMDSLAVEQSLFLSDGATFKGDVILHGAEVGGQVNASGSTFESALNMDSLAVEQSLFLSDGATFKGKVNLLGAKVGGNLEADGSTFESALDMESLAAELHVLLRYGATFKGKVNLLGAKIGGGLDLSSATFHQDVDASNAVIERELRLDTSWAARPLWGQTARLVLRNTSVGALQDRLHRLPAGALHDAWPSRPHLQLDGFTYGRLGGVGSDYESEMMRRPTSWYLEWLRRDVSFSHQPYSQLASVFQEAGASGKASEVLFELRQREREEAWRQGEYFQWFKLSALRWVIGYGIGLHYFLALLWALLLTLFGAWALWSGSAMAKSKGRTWCIWASLDEILPIVQLDKEHEELVNEWLRGWRLYYFYMHRMAGFILGTFIIAGLAGLTQGV